MQGTLILLPALLLAGLGFYSLRQDNVLAKHEAQARARRFAIETADRLLAHFSEIDLPTVSANTLPASNPENDPIVRLNQSPWVRSGFAMDADGRLLLPPPLAPLPLPSPLSAAELDSAQHDAWLALDLQLSTGDAQFEECDRLLAEFIETHPPERFVAIAKLRTAMAARKGGHMDRCRQLLQSVAELPQEIAGESGAPFDWAVKWQLAETSSGREAETILNQLCGTAVMEGSRLSEALIDRACGLRPQVAKWMEVWISHNEARALHETVSRSVSSADIANIAGEECLPVIRPVQNGIWVIAVSLSAAAKLCADLQQSSADAALFRSRVTIGERPLSQEAASGEPLVVVNRVLPVLNGEWPLRVETWLANADAFYAQQRTRSIRFGALIAASAAAVFIGFLTAWRAFRRQQQLSEMKTNFVSSVSHELRAPIASVRLMAEELAEGDTPSPEKQQQYHRFIGQECRRLSAVIENVLDFSRREQGREQFEFESTELTTLVNETVELMRPYAEEKNVRLKLTQSGHPLVAEADGRALQRLLVNLIDNAIKHSPADCTVRVGMEAAPPITRLWVEDDGPGIAPSEHERIFERFYRVGNELRRETQGVGLGLSIVKHIAEVHGGCVKVHSNLGKGSRFIVELPLQIVESSTLNGAAV